MTYRLVLAMFICSALCAQNVGKPLKFEVASVKPSAPGGQSCGSTLSSLLQFTVQSCTVLELVRNSRGLRSYELSVPPNPGWLSSARYDITARSSSPVSPGNHWQMLQSLLEERFALKLHSERRQLPVYYLSRSRNGLKLPRNGAQGCVPFNHKSPPHPPRPDEPPYCDYVSMPFTKDGLGLQIDGTEVSMASFVSPTLVNLLGRPVIDETGFTGTFDVHLKVARDSIPAMSGSPGGLAPANEPSGLPDIFTAIRSLGINVEAGKALIDVFVIDSVRRPSEN
jgi:uncharacterized protein (TIGR03435 family)